ncbi:MAG: hypothetical protein LBV17_09890 [Treponema sp.]|jgi:hypothetical protein|nr:hypothetical protein [Treponema sp.]
MTEQEIRAKAIELTIQAVSLMPEAGREQMINNGFRMSGNDTVTYPFIFHCHRFEKYIRAYPVFCVNENLDFFPITIYTKFMTSLAEKLLEI